MISSFTVGSIFKIIDEASPALKAILAQVRALNVQLDQARASLTSLGKFATPAGLTAAVTETGALATAWREVAAASALASRNLTTAGAAGRSAAASAAIGGGAGAGGGGGRHRPSWLGGGGGMHFRGPSVGLPGGGHVRGGGAAMAGVGLLGYAGYEAAEIEKYVFQLIYHSGLEQNDANRAKFRKVIQDSMVSSGYGVKDIAESALQEIRMFQGTPGAGLDVLPEMLRAATTEAMLKGSGSSPQESMRALIGLAHMTKQYDPASIRKLAPAFAFLSTANPARLASIERAAGYAVPLLQSGLEIDPMESLLLGTALTRAGATNTKSGTWLREMALRAMPGTSMMSKFAYKKHEAALKEIGLVDEAGRPTWFDEKGKPDLEKMLSIAGPRAAAIPVERRAGLERQLFGAQGGGAFALLADPAVNEQVRNLRKTMDSPEFKNKYAGFTEQYMGGSTAQMARTALQDFNVTMMELGATILPAVTGALKDFKAIIEGIRAVIPGSDANKWRIGARGIEGAAIGAGIGFVTPIPGGAALGAATGAIVGGGLGALENEQLKNWKGPGSKDWKAPNLNPWAPPPSAAPKPVVPPITLNVPPATLPPITLNLNVDGRSLAQAVSEELQKLHEHATGAPAANGLSLFGRADGGITSE
jgi:hypothetical protein